jgi:uncharacterized protein YndB with AHSA1/START domain
LDAHVVSAERIIAAPPEAIFDLLADASRHPDLDGSGQLRGVRSGAPERLCLGATFGMSMHMGVGYSMVNTVIEFEENRRIAWQSTLAGRWGHVLGGRIWRYELEPAGEGTLVRESWDISRDHQRRFLRHGKVVEATRANIERTLDRIDALVAPAS